MPTTFTYNVKVRVLAAAHGGGDLSGFLDMLRYERAVVTGHVLGSEAAIVTIEMTHPADEARWSSFLLAPRRVGIHVEPGKAR